MDAHVLVKISQWYYRDHLTQEQIAGRIGVSRSTVSRLLAQAQRRGIVQIHVDSSQAKSFDVALERALENTYDLDEAIVCEAENDPTPVLARVTGDLLLRGLTDNTTIGLSWGRSVASVVDYLPVQEPLAKNLTVVSLSGGVGPTRPDILSNALVVKLAEKLNARAYTLNAPVIVQSPEVSQTLLSEPTIGPVLSLARSCQLALVGIGAVGEFSTLSTLRYLDPELIRELTGLGAVGDICSRFYTFNGEPVMSEIDRRTIGVDIPTLKQIPRVIGITWGREKARAIVGALRMKVLNVLVTDEATAKDVLAYA